MHLRNYCAGRAAQLHFCRQIKSDKMLPSCWPSHNCLYLECPSDSPTDAQSLVLACPLGCGLSTLDWSQCHSLMVRLRFWLTHPRPHFSLIHTNVPTYIHAYIPTYIHIHTCSYQCVCVARQQGCLQSDQQFFSIYLKVSGSQAFIDW